MAKSKNSAVKFPKNWKGGFKNRRPEGGGKKPERIPTQSGGSEG